MDYEGDDVYTSTGSFGQGSASAGVGMLIDLSGRDKYDCYAFSQGCGLTRGVGIILDAAGDDSYRSGGFYSEAFKRNISLSQGAGFGRRADSGDGHCLSGGIGILVDGSGDDVYKGHVYCQGTAYWWALGLFEDRSGDDTYTCSCYSLGSAPHFAIGCCVDLEGDDKYNIGNEDMGCALHGHARDGSIAVFYDGDGDDEYYHSNRCSGEGDLNSIAVFWDRRGDDIYTCNRDVAYKEQRSYGGTSIYPLFRNFRDTMASIGLFLDTGGKDVYNEIEPKKKDKDFLNLEAKDNGEWRHTNETTPYSRSFGIDVERFPTPRKE